MTRPAVVVVFLLALIAVPSASATQLEPSSVIGEWFSPVQAFGSWLRTTVFEWLGIGVVTAEAGTHIIPDGLNCEPEPPGDGDLGNTQTEEAPR